MTIFVEVVDERLEVSDSDLPGQVYRTNAAVLIVDAANQPYRRCNSDHWFGFTHRPALIEMNGRPC